MTAEPRIGSRLVKEPQGSGETHHPLATISINTSDEGAGKRPESDLGRRRVSGLSVQSKNVRQHFRANDFVFGNFDFAIVDSRRG
jgi:hypothetical protein